MSERRWPLAVVAVLAALAITGAAWAAGRASAPDAPTAGGAPAAAPSGAVRVVEGVAVGVQHSRAGVLAASDNYVATATQNAVQDPALYSRLVRVAYAPSYQQTALKDAEQTRERSPRLTTLYGSGGKTVVMVGARRLDSYDDTEAETTSWVGGVTWGSDEKTQQSWSLVETTLRWDGQRWLVTKLTGASRAAPTPQVVGFDTAESRTSAAFKRELRGMSGPLYGSG